MKINLYLLSKYRTELMGVATLLIIICHSVPYGVLMPSWLATIVSNGGLGVDIFLFLSGLGMHFSYGNLKESGGNLPQWYLKRLLRVVIPCALIIVPYRLWQYGVEEMAWGQLMVELSGFGAIVDMSPLWYVSCALLLYIITPILYPVINGSHKWQATILLCVLCLSFGYLNKSILGFMINRWPSFIIGMAMADVIKNKKEVSFLGLTVLPLIVYAALYFCNHVLCTRLSLFWLQGIPIMVLSAYLIDKIKAISFNKLLAFVGGISLESYATNEYLIKYLASWNWSIGDLGLNYGGYLWYFGGSVICIGVSYLVHQASACILLRK